MNTEEKTIQNIRKHKIYMNNFLDSLFNTIEEEKQNKFKKDLIVDKILYPDWTELEIDNRTNKTNYCFIINFLKNNKIIMNVIGDKIVIDNDNYIKFYNKNILVYRLHIDFIYNNFLTFKSYIEKY